MKISSAYLIATGSSQGYANNGIDENHQNMESWDLTGNVTQSYADGMNTLSFQNAGGSGGTGGYGNYEAPNGVNYHYYVDATGYDATPTKFKIYGNKKFCFTNYKNAYKGEVGGHMFYNPIGTVTSGGIVYIGTVQAHPYQDKTTKIATIAPQSGRSIWTDDYAVFYDNQPPTGSSLVRCNPDLFPDVPIIDTVEGMTEFLTSPDPFTGKVSLTVQTEMGGHYEFRFMGCTSTGFTSEGGEIKIEAGGGTPILADFGNAASEVPVLHSVEFVAEGSSVTITFDLSKMVQANGVTVKIGSLTLYKVTR